jgi:hypothetical protein
MSDDIEDIVAMARAASRDDRLADGALYGKLADEIERFRMAVAMTEMSLRAQRRDYIATACLSAIIVRQDCSGSVDDCARDAIRYADALIVQFDKEAILARLDKEAKP